MPQIQMLRIPNVGEDVKQQEFLFITGGNTKWYNHFGRQFVVLLERENVIFIGLGGIQFVAQFPFLYLPCLLQSIEYWERKDCEEKINETSYVGWA